MTGHLQMGLAVEGGSHLARMPLSEHHLPGTYGLIRRGAHGMATLQPFHALRGFGVGTAMT